MSRRVKKSHLRRDLHGLTVLAACCLVGFSIFAGRRKEPGDKTERPIAAPEQSSWDFGAVEAGPTLVAKFSVRNPGGRRLVLNEKSLSCECASTGTPTLIIPPGECGVVVARLKTRGLRGSFAIKVDYSTSDPTRPTLTFTLRADVHSSVDS